MKYIFVSLVAFLVSCTPSTTPSTTTLATPDSNVSSGHTFKGILGTSHDPNGPDLDCQDFADQPDAQAFYELAGGPAQDRHRLDWNKNGIPCEVNETWTTDGTGGPPVVAPTPSKPGFISNVTCSSFSRWSTAQAYYLAWRDTQAAARALDKDGDGVACESLPGHP
jgi:Excalibur calcium-binding domain